MTIWSAFTLSIYLNLIYLFLLRDINNNNNNLFLRSRTSQTPNWCMRPPPPSDITGKVYGGIHTLPPSGFELLTSQEETHVLNHWAHSGCIGASHHVLCIIYILNRPSFGASHPVFCITYIVKGCLPLEVEYSLAIFWSLVHNINPFPV